MKNLSNFTKTIIGVVVFALVLTVALLLIKKISNQHIPMVRTGQIEMREYDLASKLPGRIEWINFDEGDIITEGDEVFKITDKEIKAKVAQAAGALESANAQYSLVNEGLRTEQIEMAEKKYNADKSQFELAEKTFTRMINLYSDKLISTQEFDAIESKFKSAKAAMEASLSQYNMAVKGARSQEKMMAKGQVIRAKETMNEARAYFDETIARSPWSGIVSKRFIDKGELVATGYPVLSIIDTSDVWAELNLPATELEKLKIGMTIKGKIHGLGVTKEFKVINYSAMADYANWRSTGDNSTFDVRSFTVKLKPLKKNISSLRPGMTVSFDLEHLK